MSDYTDLLASKAQLADSHGFTPTGLPEHLYGFQHELDPEGGAA